MSCAGRPIRRRSQATISALPTRACHGHTPRPTGRRRPTARSARPDRTSSSIASELGGVERPVAVHERDQLGGGREQPGVHGGAVPGRGLVDDAWPRARRATSAVPSVEPLSTTIDARSPRGRRAAAPRSAGRLVAARQHQVAVVLHAVHARKSTSVDGAVEPLRSRDASAGAPGDRADPPRLTACRDGGAARPPPRGPGWSRRFSLCSRRSAPLGHGVGGRDPVRAGDGDVGVPAVARAVGPALRARHRARRTDRAARVAVRRRPGGPAALAAPAPRRRTSSGWPGCSSLAFVDGPVGHLAGAGQPLRVPRHRPRRSTTCRLCSTATCSRIRRRNPDNWSTHVAGHPPGALLFFVGLVRVGLGRRLRRRAGGHAVAAHDRPSPCW